MKRVLLRYVAYQIPGVGIVAVLLAGLHAWAGLPAAAAWGLLALWLAKEVVLFPLTWKAYDERPGGIIGPERLIGARGVAQDDLEPRGRVRVQGELWRAELEDGCDAIARGSGVVVGSVRDLTLLVRPEGAERVSGETGSG